MKSTLIILFSLVFIISNPALSGEGFTTLSRKSKEVQSVGKSIFKILMRNNLASENTIPGLKVAEILLTQCLQDELSFHDEMNCKHLSNCFGYSCHLPYVASGTAFLVNNGQTLATAMHVSWLSHQAKWVFLQEPLKNMEDSEFWTNVENFKPEFKLFDQEGNEVYDSLIEPVRRISGGDPRKFIGPRTTGSPLFSNEDFEVFELTRVIGEPLPLANKSVELGDKVYTVGFPTKTVRARGKNSNGKSIYYSEGFVRDGESFVRNVMKEENVPEVMLEEIDIESLKDATGEEILKAFGFSEQVIKNTKEQLDPEKFAEVCQSYIKAYPSQNSIYAPYLSYFKEGSINAATMDSVFGNSGGPVFNEANEVVGLISATASNTKEFKSLGSIFKNILEISN